MQINLSTEMIEKTLKACEEAYCRTGNTEFIPIFCYWQSMLQLSKYQETESINQKG